MSERDVTRGAKKLGIAALGVIIILIIMFGHRCLVSPTPYRNAPVEQQQGN